MIERTFVFKMPLELIQLEDLPNDTFLSREVLLEQRKVKQMSIKDALSYNHPELTAQVERIILSSRNKRMNKDGFEPGWQENINAYAGGRKEYEKLLRERGLVEIGYETDHVKESTYSEHCMQSDEFIKGALEIGVELSGNEIEAMKSGEYFDASKCDLSGDE